MLWLAMFAMYMFHGLYCASLFVNKMGVRCQLSSFWRPTTTCPAAIENEIAITDTESAVPLGFQVPHFPRLASNAIDVASVLVASTRLPTLPSYWLTASPHTITIHQTPVNHTETQKCSPLRRFEKSRGPNKMLQRMSLRRVSSFVSTNLAAMWLAS